MKQIIPSVVMLAGMIFSGCGSTPEMTYGRAGPPPATTRTFQADPRAVYDAARASLAKMEFRVTGGGPAQGKIEAVSGLSTDASLTSTRQILISVRITSSIDGGSEVAAKLKEVIEEDSDRRQGFATQTPLRDTPYYEVFFNGLEQALLAPKKD